MCWCYEVSIASFLIGFIISITLIKRNKNYDKMIGYLILFYSFIQLFESQLWKAINNNNIQQNLYYTKLIYLTLWIQAFAIGFGIYQITNEKLIMNIGIILFIYGFITMPIFKVSLPNKERHIKWGFDDTYYILVSIIIGYGIIKYTDIKYTWLSILFFVGSYLYLKINHNASVGTLWCWFASVFSIYWLIY
jgi:hypothetical protein